MKIDDLNLTDLRYLNWQSTPENINSLLLFLCSDVLVRGLSLDLIERKSINNQVDVVDSRTKTGADPT